MLCCLTFDQMARWRMTLARGVQVLSMLGLVNIWYRPGEERILLALPWWRSSTGQSLTEYALLLATSGGLVWAAWSMFQPVATEAVHLVVHLVYSGWADWLVAG